MREIIIESAVQSGDINTWLSTNWRIHGLTVSPDTETASSVCRPLFKCRFVRVKLKKGSMCYAVRLWGAALHWSFVNVAYGELSSHNDNVLTLVFPSCYHEARAGVQV